jgi:hypothetical protein
MFTGYCLVPSMAGTTGPGDFAEWIELVCNCDPPLARQPRGKLSLSVSLSGTRVTRHPNASLSLSGCSRGETRGSSFCTTTKQGVRPFGGQYQFECSQHGTSST